MIVVSCHTCGSDVEKFPSRVDRNGNNFCSRDCYDEWQRSGARSGEDSHLYDGGPSIVSCDFCGSEMERIPSHVENREHLFCNDSCRGRWMSNNITGSDHPNWKPKVAVHCDNCGDEVDKKPSLASRPGLHFCGLSCKGEYWSENFSGEDNPKWRGGKELYYGPTWENQRRSALNRDQHRCQRCFAPRSLLGQNPDVHHIIPFRVFDDYDVANRLANLISLCRECHMEVEYGYSPVRE